MTAIAQFGINRQYNRWLKEMGRYDAEMRGLGKPSGFAQAIGFAKILPRFYKTTSATQLRGLYVFCTIGLASLGSNLTPPSPVDVYVSPEESV